MKNNKWLNGVVYPCKRIGEYPQIYVQRRMHGKYKGIIIQCFESRGLDGTTIHMRNTYARLLLKRIKMCLGDE